MCSIVLSEGFIQYSIETRNECKAHAHLRIGFFVMSIKEV